MGGRGGVGVGDGGDTVVNARLVDCRGDISPARACFREVARSTRAYHRLRYPLTSTFGGVPKGRSRNLCEMPIEKNIYFFSSLVRTHG